jgi:hypothetical protein
MSGKSVSEKLFVKEGYRVLIINEPDGYRTALGKLPQKVGISTKKSGQADLIQLFVGSRKELEANLPPLMACLKPKGLLWVSYPKGTSKVKTDINRDTIGSYAQSIGMQPVAMISIDGTWSALRLKHESEA